MYPILFTLPGGIPVYGYGVMLGLSCVVGAHLGVYLATRSGVARDKAWWFCLTIIIIALIGGRAHELLVQGTLFSGEALEVAHSGRTAYGGFISAIVAAIVVSRVLGISYWVMGDLAGVAMALGLGMTRVGCFLYGCDYGMQSESFGIAFPKPAPAWADQIDAGLISETATHSLPVLPAQLLASFAGFAIFGFLLWYWFRRPRRYGTVFLLFLLVYGLVRAGLEQIRADEGRGELLGLSTSTTIGLTTAAIAAVLLYVPPLAKLRPEAGPVLDVPEEEEPESEPDQSQKQGKGKGKKGKKGKGKGKKGKKGKG